MSEKRDFKFDKKAEKYDDSYEGKLSEKFYTLVTENVRLTDGMAVLEMGCGTGTILHRLSQRCSISGHGIDVEEKMLEQARKKCPDMEILNCSCDNTPFEDGKFDVIVACMAYHHFPEQKRFREEALRVLKPGGSLYICDPRFPAPVRWTLNTFFRDAGFRTAGENTKAFEGTGFSTVKIVKDQYVQVLHFEKRTEDDRQ